MGTLLQMVGRAGRPGFDKSGTAVVRSNLLATLSIPMFPLNLTVTYSVMFSFRQQIMTDSLSKTRYENISQG